MKRIAIVSFSFPESSLCLAKYIASQGVSVDYYFIAFGLDANTGVTQGLQFKPKTKFLVHRMTEEDAPEIISYFGGLPLRFFYQGTSSSKRYFIHQRIGEFLLARRLKRHKYDAINIVGNSSIILSLHRKLKDVNIVHTFHEIGSHQNNIPSTPLIDEVIKDRSKVILHSQTTCDRLFALSNVDKSIVTVLPFGRFETNLLYVKPVDVKLPFKNNNPTFLFFGRIVPYKGLDLLKESVELLKPLHNSFNLIIAGGGEDSNVSYFEQLENCYVRNCYLPTDEMMRLIQLSDVIVLPYHTASQTGIISTCSLYNKPVIATQVGAFPEMVVNGVTGLLVEKDNPAAFAEAMKSCISSTSILQKMTAGCSNWGNGDKFDWNRIAVETINYMYN